MSKAKTIRKMVKDTSHGCFLHVHGLRLPKLLNILNDIAMILTTPLIAAGFFIEILLVFTCICLAGIYGYWAIALGVLTQLPIIYVVSKEIWRREHLLPPSEAWETTSEDWSETFREYVEKIRRKTKHI